MDQNTWNNTEVVSLSSSFVNINVLGTEQGKLYNYSKPPMVVLTDPKGKVLEKYNTELSASEVTDLQHKVLAEASTVSPSSTSKATGVPGFEAVPAFAGIMIAVALRQVVQRFR